MLFGEGERSNQISQLPISRFIEISGPLFFGLLLLVAKAANHIRRHNFSKAKSYLLAGILLAAIYPFRLQLVYVVIRMFT